MGNELLTVIGKDQKYKFKNRIKITLTRAHYQGNDLLPLIIKKFIAKPRPFPEYAFLPSVVQNVSPDNWWMHHQFVDDKTMPFIVSLLTAKASSAGVERIFSSFGFIRSTLRNRLGNEKAGFFYFFYLILIS